MNITLRTHNETLFDLLSEAPTAPESAMSEWVSRQINGAFLSGEFDALPRDTREMLNAVQLVALNVADRAREREAAGWRRRRPYWLRYFGF